MNIRKQKEVSFVKGSGKMKKKSRIHSLDMTKCRERAREGETKHFLDVLVHLTNERRMFEKNHWQMEFQRWCVNHTNFINIQLDFVRVHKAAAHNTASYYFSYLTQKFFLVSLCSVCVFFVTFSMLCLFLSLAWFSASFLSTFDGKYM